MQTPAGDGRWRGACGRSSLPSKGRAGRAGPGRALTHLAINHHPQPWQCIAGRRAGPGARGGPWPRATRGAGRPRPPAGLMARPPPVPAGPAAPSPAPACPLSAPCRAALPAARAPRLRAARAPGAQPGRGGDSRGHAQPVIWPRPSVLVWARPVLDCLSRPRPPALGHAPCRVRPRPVLDSARLQPRSAPVCARPPPPRSRPSAECQQVWSELGA